MTDGISPAAELLSANKEKLEKLLATVEHSQVIENFSASTRMHFLKFDGNGQPAIKALSELMFEHAIDYCLSARERPAKLSPQESMRLSKAARKLFVHPAATEEDPDQTGEAGELLLYLLIEAVLGAPQVVAKMELKTNPNLEVNGSDGIHMSWSDKDSVVDIYFGEAKLYKDLGSALSAALKSIDKFHEDDILRHELLLVTKQFKYAHDAVKEMTKELLESGVPSEGVRINHACLIGYNWNEYLEIFKSPVSQRLTELTAKYLADAERIHKLCNSKLTSFKNKHVNLVFFFLPFNNVQDFRDAFNEAMGSRKAWTAHFLGLAIYIKNSSSRIFTTNSRERLIKATRMLSSYLRMNAES